jgi:hypothetical protein
MRRGNQRQIDREGDDPDPGEQDEVGEETPRTAALD